MAAPRPRPSDKNRGLTYSKGYENTPIASVPASASAADSGAPHKIVYQLNPSDEAYGVRFIACGNTMHTVGWDKADMLDFAEVEEVGTAAVMELQEQGYAHLAW